MCLPLIRLLSDETCRSFYSQIEAQTHSKANEKHAEIPQKAFLFVVGILWDEKSEIFTKMCKL